MTISLVWIALITLACTVFGAIAGYVYGHCKGEEDAEETNDILRELLRKARDPVTLTTSEELQILLEREEDERDMK